MNLLKNKVKKGHLLAYLYTYSVFIQYILFNKLSILLYFHRFYIYSKTKLFKNKSVSLYLKQRIYV